MQYSQRIVEVETKGPIALVGPKQQTIIGGQLTLHVNSLNQKGNASIQIKMDDIVKNIGTKVI